MKEVMIDYGVFLIWHDSLDYKNTINQEEAQKIIEFEAEYSENAITIGYDPMDDLYYMRPVTLMQQWNWLAENQPKSYFDIPEAQRRKR